ncbi:MAG: ComEA family DNA-binding protein [Chloroflexaceae bacterium]|nr:ComEA family DNA-binding protein [Chloroflexaceae bacterium]
MSSEIPSPESLRRVSVWLYVMLLLVGAISMLMLGFFLANLFVEPSTESAPVDPLPNLGEADIQDWRLILTPEPTATEPPTPTPPPVVVYITGAVQHPEVYEMPHDARIKDVVRAAGGFTSDADRDNINLSARIYDEQHIDIPFVDDIRTPVLLSSPSGVVPGQSQQNTGQPAQPTGALLNINTASATELEDLPNIGQATAQRIIDYRTNFGPFSSVDDLENVSGIGSATLEKIRPLITAR